MATASASGILEIWPPDMAKSSQSTSSNPKPDKASRQMDKKFVNNQDSKKVPVGCKGQPSKRNNRKGKAACKAVVYDVDGFCKRCSARGTSEPDTILKARDSGKLPQLTWGEDRRGLDDISGPELSGLGHKVKPNTSKADESPSTSNGQDTNIVIVLDVDDEAAPNDIPRDEADHRGGGSENSAQHGPNVEVAAVNSQAGASYSGSSTIVQF